jgi:hypothetical protein
MVERRIILSALVAGAAFAGSYYYLCVYKTYCTLPESAPIEATSTQSTPAEPSEPSEQTTAPIEQPAPQTPAAPSGEQAAERMVTITNDITKKMITYHKALGSYTPKFSIEINGTPVDFGKQISVAAHNNSLDIKYHYNFLNGYRVGWRTTRVTLPPEGDAFTLTFSWKDTNHIILSNAVAYAIINEKK